MWRRYDIGHPAHSKRGRGSRGIELRIRNEPDKDPTNGRPFSSRRIVEAWRAGAQRFGWSRRPTTPGSRRDGEWRVGMGLGLALMEDTQFDERNGRIMNPSLAEYHVPVHLDVPEIDIIWNDIPDPHTPMGARGLGEIGITGTGAAVANAIYNATGRRVRDLPITLDKLL